MTSPKKSRWIAAGVIGSLAFATGLAPTAFAAEPEAVSPERSSPSPLVALSLTEEHLALTLEGNDGGRATGEQEGFTVGPEAKTRLTADGAHAFLGRPGQEVWVLGDESTVAPQESEPSPEASQWSTEAVDAAHLDAEGLVRWALTGLEGPGDVTVFDPGSDASGIKEQPRVLFDSSDGLSDVQDLAAGTSGRMAWAFTEPGEYHLTSQASTTLESGVPVTTTARWTVQVRDTAPAPGPRELLPVPPSAPGNTGTTPAPVRPAVQSSPAAGRVATADSGDIVNQKVEIDDGHVDAIAGRMVGGRLRTLFKDSRNPGRIIWREPSSVVLRVEPAAKEKVPASDTYAFLGKPGTDFWLIPQVQKQGVVWAGWNTEALGAGDLGGPVKMKLEKVTGPGSLAIWETAGLGGAHLLFNSRDGLPDTHQVDLGVHAHANWAFSKEGTYQVTFQLGGTLPNGTATADSQTFTFVVGDGAPDDGGTGGGGTDTGGTGGGNDGGGSTGGTGDGPGSGTGGGTSGGSTGGTNGGSSGDPNTAGSASTAGASTDGGTTTGAAKGSLAHTGGGTALPLAAGAGVLILGGAAAVALTRTRRRGLTAGGS
ncbi:choice-of-anchor M domain-containing protein [Streptomyces sp. NPDC088757]|uniref:choice-of-anchor M domain-containing protein n=1 Tax=Streptomyces sp. NPDC088757 TaxID=3365889 RepID=UPI00381BC237